MSDRYCIRWCTARGSHLAACERRGEKDDGPDPCRGFAPVDAREGALICERCYRRLRRHLEDAADVVGHLRSIADPTKATAYHRVRVQSSSIEILAPVAADLIDASNDITTTLNMWANHVSGEDRPGAGLAAGATADAAHGVVRLAADVILDDLDHLANDSHQIEVLCDGVILVNGATPEVWTVADAAMRWPLDDAPRWAQAAYPDCDLMAVRVQPGRNGCPTRYHCTTEGRDWEANSDDDGGLWASVFAEPAAREIRVHDPPWLTLASAPRSYLVRLARFACGCSVVVPPLSGAGTGGMMSSLPQHRRREQPIDRVATVGGRRACCWSHATHHRELGDVWRTRPPTRRIQACRRACGREAYEESDRPSSGREEPASR